MKSAVLKALGGVVSVMVACNVYAQASDAAAGAQAAQTSVKAEKKANRQLGRQVRAALAKAKGLDVSSIAVRAKGGAVTLTGTVPDQGQIELAGTTAKGVAGVSSVSNKLNVQQQ